MEAKCSKSHYLIKNIWFDPSDDPSGAETEHAAGACTGDEQPLSIHETRHVRWGEPIASPGGEDWKCKAYRQHYEKT